MIVGGDDRGVRGKCDVGDGDRRNIYESGK